MSSHSFQQIESSSWPFKTHVSSKISEKKAGIDIIRETVGRSVGWLRGFIPALTSKSKDSNCNIPWPIRSAAQWLSQCHDSQSPDLKCWKRWRCLCATQMLGIEIEYLTLARWCRAAELCNLGLRWENWIELGNKRDLPNDRNKASLSWIFIINRDLGWNKPQKLIWAHFLCVFCRERKKTLKKHDDDDFA